MGTQNIKTFVKKTILDIFDSNKEACEEIKKTSQEVDKFYREIKIDFDLLVYNVDEMIQVSDPIQNVEGSRIKFSIPVSVPFITDTGK